MKKSSIVIAFLPLLSLACATPVSRSIEFTSESDLAMVIWPETLVFTTIHLRRLDMENGRSAEAAFSVYDNSDLRARLVSNRLGASFVQPGFYAVTHFDRREFESLDTMMVHQYCTERLTVAFELRAGVVNIIDPEEFLIALGVVGFGHELALVEPESVQIALEGYPQVTAPLRVVDTVSTVQFDAESINESISICVEEGAPFVLDGEAVSLSEIHDQTFVRK
ncbi:hypothetical protein [Hyphobacterium sp.]|uniref:hypothetical protein n=1 Tax=Hyphobacterium sp. TaxID=2004662 RepID=UPI003BA8BB8E